MERSKKCCFDGCTTTDLPDPDANLADFDEEDFVITVIDGSRVPDGAEKAVYCSVECFQAHRNMRTYRD